MLKAYDDRSEVTVKRLLDLLGAIRSPILSEDLLELLAQI
jgi:hypothetical protein